MSTVNDQAWQRRTDDWVAMQNHYNRIKQERIAKNRKSLEEYNALKSRYCAESGK